MKQKICTNHNYKILSKDPSDSEWVEYNMEFNTPQKIYFTLNNVDTIANVIWAVNHKIKSKKCKELSHSLKKHQESNTYTINATAYDKEFYYITESFTITANKFECSNYVDSALLKEQICEYYKGDIDIIPDEIALSIYKIANRLAFASNFINYTYIDEMVGDALVRMLSALKNRKFNPEKGNPFSYFTMIAYTAFCNRIKIEKRLKSTHDTYQEQTFEKYVSEGLLPYVKANSVEDEDNQYYD